MSEIRFNYTSPFDLIHDISWDEKTPDLKLQKGVSHSTNKNSFGHSYNGDDWFKTDNYDQAKDLLFEGCNFDQIESIKKLTLDTLLVEEVTTCYDVAGDYVDLGRYLDHEPECMVDFLPVEVDRNDLHIVVNVCESGAVNGDDMAKKGAIICAAIEKMELENSCRVKFSIAPLWKDPSGGGQKHIMQIKIKDYDQPMNMAELSGAMHPSFFRRVCFAWIEKYFPKATFDGYGRVVNFGDYSKSDLEKSFESETQNVLFIGNMSSSDDINRRIKDAKTPQEMSDAAQYLIDIAKTKFKVKDQF